ncbi:hypothetical protein N8612_05975 [Verrucomicrobia bacterium]|nr:hypothetical protein [Verrucomicrobiota bacterium]
MCLDIYLSPTGQSRRLFSGRERVPASHLRPEGLLVPPPFISADSLISGGIAHIVSLRWQTDHRVRTNGRRTLVDLMA